MIGSATGALAVPLAAIISTRWFSTRRGLVSGLLTASNASGQLVFLPLLAWISVNYGWRWTAGAVVIAASGLVIPLAIIFLRHSPAEIGIAPYGASEPDPPVPPLVNPFRSAIATLREFAGRRDFQLLVFAFFVCGATTNGLIGTHLIAACADHGFTQVQGASLLAAIGIFDIVGTITSGWLTDRYDPRWLLFWYYALRGISLLGLNAALSSAGLGLAAFVIFDGLDWVATVPPTIALCRKMAGPERVGVVFAWASVAPARRGLRGLGRRFHAHLARYLRARVSHLGRARDRRGDGQPADRPALRAPALRLRTCGDPVLAHERCRCVVVCGERARASRERIRLSKGFQPDHRAATPTRSEPPDQERDF